MCVCDRLIPRIVRPCVGDSSSDGGRIVIGFVGESGGRGSDIYNACSEVQPRTRTKRNPLRIGTDGAESLEVGEEGSILLL